ncbi:MAG TPA: alkaline phosphatase family protein [Chthoniobacterales bacterium]|jgi:tetratricopeptide (TPR) repeat protein|nr:alkaline phosphatase family protein [Chthoniobacterales bacterium]
MSERLAKKVLLLGWDAADWKIIQPLLEAGLMPNLERLVSAGVMGKLLSLQPMLSPMLWNSIATGKRADKHGVHGFIEADPLGGVRPVTSTSRRCKAIWNILTQSGLRTHVLGWFASHPAEPINGVCVTNQFGLARDIAPGQPWPLPPETIYPARLSEALAQLRVHPSTLSVQDMHPFVPQAETIDQNKDRRLWIAAVLLAECVNMHAAATWVMENEPWDFMAICDTSIDHFCHQFMHYHPPRMEHIPEQDFSLYKEVVNGCYGFHDMLLGRLLELAGEDTTVLLCSDHGYYSDNLRPLLTPQEAAGPAVWHRPFGIFALKGPHVREDEWIFGPPTLLDIAPTVLTLFGLPIGADMDGKPLLEAFTGPVEIATIPSWEMVEGECGMHPPDRHQDPAASRALLQQFVALGYIEKPDADAEKAVESAEREGRYNLAQALLDGRRPAEALPLLEELHAAEPARMLLSLTLANCYLALGRLADSRRIVEALAQDKDAGTAAFGQQQARLVPQIDLLMGMICFQEGKTEEALANLKKVEALQQNIRHLQQELGRAYLKLRAWKEAESAFNRELKIDDDNPASHHGLAVALLNQRRNEEAAEHCLRAIALAHHMPLAHYHLGLVLTRLGQDERAILALETGLMIEPGLLNAHRLLALLYNERDPAKASAHRKMTANSRHPPSMRTKSGNYRYGVSGGRSAPPLAHGAF